MIDAVAQFPGLCIELVFHGVVAAHHLGCTGKRLQAARAGEHLGVAGVDAQQAGPVGVGAIAVGVAHHQHIIVSLKIKHGCSADLLQVAGTGNRQGLLARLGQGRQQHGRQNGDNGDDDQQLDEGETIL